MRAWGCNVLVSVMSVGVQCSILFVDFMGLGQGLRWWIEYSNLMTKLRIEGSMFRRSTQVSMRVSRFVFGIFAVPVSLPLLSPSVSYLAGMFVQSFSGSPGATS